MKVGSNINSTSSDYEGLNRTNLTIDIAKVSFTILEESRYRCTFKLIVSGNEYTSHGEAQGNFSFPTNSINMTYLDFQETEIIPSLTYNNNRTYCYFQSDLILPVGVSEQLSGSFVGKCYSNTSVLYTYHLGIDWGRTVGNQLTSIVLDGSKMDLVDFSVPEGQEPRTPYTEGNIVIYNWEDWVCLGFNGTFIVYNKVSNPNLLKISKNDWNVSFDQNVILKIQNIGLFDVDIKISTPTWIDCNATEFQLDIDETRTILFTINSKATFGLVDTILIIILGSHYIYPIDAIEIEVTTGSDKNQIGGLLLLLFSISIIFIMIPAILYYQRPKIYQIINQIKKQVPSQHIGENKSIISEISDDKFSKSREVTWESIQHRWEPILPSNELKVLKILNNYGSMNQQRLANHLGVSKVTMSRLISRLESKRLIYRERLGMSNIINLNEEVL